MSSSPSRGVSKPKEAPVRAAFGVQPAGFDEEIYGAGPGANKYAGFANVVVEEGDDEPTSSAQLLPQAVDLSKLRRPTEPSITAPQRFLDEATAAAARAAKASGDDDPFKKYQRLTIAERQSEYHARRLDRGLSPPRDAQGIIVADEEKAAAESEEPPRETKRRRKRWDLGPSDVVPPVLSDTKTGIMPPPPPPPPKEHKSRWDEETPVAASASRTRWDVTPAVGGLDAQTASKWEPTSVMAGTASASKWDATPVMAGTASASRWDETPGMLAGGGFGATPTGTTGGKRSRWDETPLMKASSGFAASPAIGGNGGLPGITPEVMHASRMQADLDERNRPYTDAELDTFLPSEGFTILKPPSSYVPIRTPARKLAATPAPLTTPLYALPADGGVGVNDLGIPFELPDALKGMEMKPEDYHNFANVLDRNTVDSELSIEEQRDRKIMRLLLKIKNGAPAMRKVALRQITDKAREFGAGPLFSQILPLLMSPTLEDQERHLYVKVIGRILYKLDDLVRPFVHKILVVIQPLLIDEDYYARVEGREIISNLANAAGLPTMIATMRPDIDNPDEYVRNTTARAFAVVASALGIPSLLLFLKAACQSKKSWHARHTGIKIVQQMAILMGFGTLPHLRSLVEIVAPGLSDDEAKVRTVTALALAALAEASAPFGIESFEPVLKPLWQGVRQHRSKTLAAFLKAIGCVIPLMAPDYASHYAREVSFILIREFQSPDEDMKKIVLKVVKQCVSCEGVTPEYVKVDIVPEYFRCFWVRRMALDRRNYRLVVDTTLEIAIKIGGAEVVRRLVEGLKDESEPYRRMVVETIDNVATELELSDIDSKLEERLIDGMMWAFQEHGNSGGGGSGDDSPVVLNALATVVQKLSSRAQPYLKQIVSMVQWRLNNKSTKVREYAADLIAKTAAVMQICGEEELMGHLGVVLFEYLGEEFPDVLGSILRALKAIVQVIGIDNMKPPVGDLLPRLTPIMKNRHEKVQENCILLVGVIATRGARHVSAREWMRICFELLELLKAPRKAIRKSAVSTFGSIAQAIGPHDVLTTLLNNLKVQERTQRVCTTVAIAIVAEKCKPYTVVPALMNEYRIPEMNVQNGVLKSFSFLFEYIGDMSKDYIYALVGVLEDGLIDRDLVHRQTACTAVGHLALGVRGCAVEDALVHLLNHVWPNIFETSPHVVNSVMAAIEGCMVALGPGPILLYVLQGLFHPARKVRDVYWRVYNRLYVYAQDGLVACWPTVPNIQVKAASRGESPADDADGDSREEEVLGEEDRYVRHELFIMV
jgi:splicing factor 3B subunit 1